jgi:hypothetical protein
VPPSTRATPDPDPDHADRGVADDSTPQARSGRGSVSLVAADSAPWQAALDVLDHDVYHLPQHARIDARRTGGEPLALVYRDGGHVLFLPLVLHEIPGTCLRDASSSYGYPGPISTCPVGVDHPFWQEAISAIVATLASSGIVSCFVRLHPLLPVQLDALEPHGALVEHGPTVAVDLTLPAESLWRAIRSNHRRQITAAAASGLDVRFDDWSDLGGFVDAYYDNMRHVHASDSYFFERTYFDSLRSELGGSTHLVTAHHKGEVVAGALVFEHRGIVQYHLGATRSRHRDKQPMKTVIHSVIEWSRLRGNRVLHLGGGLGGRDDSLFHFKAGFSDARFAFHTWRVVTEPTAYEALTSGAAARGDDPWFFPAYRHTG